LARPATGILNMSGFLLRVVRQRSRPRAATPGRDRLY